MSKVFNIVMRGGGSAAELAVNTTWAELKTMRDNSQLTVGCLYRITDYETIISGEDVQSAGHVFDIIVLATDVNMLSEDAMAVHSERDTEGYFANSKLEAWELKYCLDNDTSRFAWASDGGEKWIVTLPELGTMYLTPISTNDSTYEGFPYKFTSNVDGMVVDLYFAHLELQEGEEFIPNIIYIAAMGQAMTNQFHVMEIEHTEQTLGKGVIWEMEDEYNNLCCYDFKNVQFKRSLIVATKEDPTEDECAFYGKYVGQAIEEGLPALPNGYAIDPNYSKYLYTFSVIGPEGNVGDNSLGVDLTSAGMGIIHLCKFNQIKANVNQSSFALDLNNIVFVSTYNSFEDIVNLEQAGNTFGSSCVGNTFINGAVENIFGSNCYYNTFGSGCNKNLFENECYRNTFGSGCDQNSFGINCKDNYFGNDCSSNSFGDDCYSNTFKDHCSSNSLGVSCCDNSFDDSCLSNLFGNYCKDNSFGNNCHSNSFGNNFIHNSFGDSGSINSFGNYCEYNSFGDSCEYNSFGNNCKYNDILRDVKHITVYEGVQYVFIGSDSGTVQYVQVLNGIRGSDSSNKLQINFAKDTSYTQVVGKNSQGNLKIWNPADLVQA